MAQRMTASSSQLKPDPRFHSILASKFVNCLMSSGKKTTALRVFYDAMDLIAAKITDHPAIEVFHTAIDNIKPSIEVRSRRVGGANYQVPTQVSSRRQQALAIRWLLEACREKKGRPMHMLLGEELMAAYRREGAAMTKRENVHRMADANKAFAHFAW
jgi:small subunit ribosomal protein S7